jgi:hypothetical protein
MAGDSVLRIKASIDAGDVGTGLQDIVSSITKIGQTASQVAGQSKNDWAALGQQLATIDPTLAGIGSTIIQIANASDKVGAAGAAGNVNQLERALLSAGVPMEMLRSKMDAIGAASPEAAAKVQAFVDVANAGFETNATKLGTLKDAYDVVKAKMDAARAAASQLGTEGGAALGDLGTKGGTALDTLNAALDKMGSTTSLRGLQQAIVQAATALEQLKTSGPTAGQSQAAFAAQVQAAQAKIDASTKSLGALKQTQLDVAASAKSSGSALENLRGSAGNLDTMFMNMSKTGNSVEKSIGSVGVAMGIMGMAITGAIAIGEKLKVWIEDGYQAWEKYTKKQEDVAIKAQLLNAANIEVGKGLIEQGATVQETIQRYVAFTVQQGKLSESARAYITTIAGLKVPPTLDELKVKYDAVTTSVVGSLARGEGAATSFYTTNKGAMTQTIAAYEDAGGKVDGSLIRIMKSLDDAAAKAAQRTADMKRSLDGVALSEIEGSAAQVALGKSVVDLGEKYRNTISDIDAHKIAEVNAINERLHALDLAGPKDEAYAQKRAALETEMSRIVLDSAAKEVLAKRDFVTSTEKVVAAAGEEGKAVAADVKIYIDRAAQTKQATADNADLGKTTDLLGGAFKRLGEAAGTDAAAGLGKTDVDIRNLTGVMDGFDKKVDEVKAGYVDSMGAMHSATVDEITDFSKLGKGTADAGTALAKVAASIHEEFIPGVNAGGVALGTFITGLSTDLPKASKTGADSVNELGVVAARVFLASALNVEAFGNGIIAATKKAGEAVAAIVVQADQAEAAVNRVKAASKDL